MSVDNYRIKIESVRETDLHHDWDFMKIVHLAFAQKKKEKINSPLSNTR